MVLSKEICPFNINFARSKTFYLTDPIPNLWSPDGNGWIQEQTFKIDCIGGFHHMDCQCQSYNVTSDDEDVIEKHNHLLGKTRFCIKCLVNVFNSHFLRYISY